MVETINPDTGLDRLDAELSTNKGALVAYFPLFDLGAKTADYTAKVEWEEGTYRYVFGGHGVGSNFVHVPDREAVLSRIVFDNERCNEGGVFHLEVLHHRSSRS